ncbi:MAG: SUF system NifU family Fe-S cluster assembly protein [Candidatus Micrarchaeota archaeon]|nr:SUF system NifU family Fe-S cluster assembly protein [Candidatus Micrarchaeota archaeon]MDE1847538.1 SUF system NifU family Fe-S cluster assembly protein [Candidatus Micrarchaeota archaeon]MDE1864255.1 SUF system NifU family Fe-S cluster assembly protein [Candidatus Micrarchaeota archaeon]
MSLDIYAERLIQYYEHPHNKGKLPGASVELHEENVTCGDKMTIYLKIRQNIVEDIKFDGDGCAISMASASMITDFVKGKSLEEVEKMTISTVMEIIGIDPGPARLHCATLSTRAIKGAVFAYQHKPMDLSTKEM